MAALAFAGDKPDFSGDWELLISKSRFGKLEKPVRMILHSENRNGVMHSEQTTYTPQGTSTVESEWYPDGKEHEDPSKSTRTVTRWEDDTLVSQKKSADGKIIQTIRLRKSTDGKTVTQDIDTRDSNGENHSVLVWEKQ